jgi:hypothetical protein
VGPEGYFGDSLQLDVPIRQSFMKGDIIKTYELYVYEYFKDTTGLKPAIIDSIVYESKILSNGVIETHRIDSVRYHRKFDMSKYVDY